MAQQQAATPTPKGGIGVLTRKLGAMLPVQFNTSVRYITPADANGRHTIHYLSADMQPKSVTPDVVVVATEGKFVPEIVRGLSPKQSQFFRSIDFTQCVAVSYILAPDGAPKEPAFGGYTRNYPDAVKRRVLAWAVLPAGAEHPDNPPVAHCFLARSEVGPWQASGKSQPDYCLPFLKAAYPAFDATKITDAITRGCEDLIYMPVGYVRAMAEVLKDQERDRKGLYFAGEYMAGAHTGAACASGRSVAANIISHWS
jgi:oxygen-dependent protoporphyrinogen oxidase